MSNYFSTVGVCAPNSNERQRPRLFIESYGVKICIVANDGAAIDAITQMLPSLLVDQYSLAEPTETEHKFTYVWNKSGRDSIYKQKEKILVRTLRDEVLDQLGTQIRLRVAEFAVGKVFIHSGVVAINGLAILIPGTSFSGKTSMVAELVKHGAIYYSDEYAVLDEDGFVHPFSKPLSIRAEGEKKQTEVAVIELGGISGADRIPIGMVVFTHFKANGKWKPKTISRSKATFEIIRNTIPIRRVPEFTISVIDLAIKDAIFVESNRNEATQVASWIIEKLNGKSHS